MTDDMMNLRSLVEKSADADFLRDDRLCCREAGSVTWPVLKGLGGEKRTSLIF
jgi:hypothetical protein